MDQRIKYKNKNLAEQASAFRSLYPDFGIYSDLSSLIVKGWVRPTARSIIYWFTLTYIINRRPKILITEPVLELNEKQKNLPHVFEGDNLCLYYSNSEFNGSKLLANTVVQWITLWVYYYEIWRVDGEWLGGGIHPTNELGL